MELWNNLPEAIYEMAKATKNECGERQSIPSRIFVYPQEFLPFSEKQNEWANGFFDVQETNEIHIRYFPEIEDTSLFHEYLEHQVPFECKGIKDANLNHSQEWRDYFRSKKWEIMQKIK